MNSKKNIFFFSFLVSLFILSNLCSASTLGISPDRIEFSLKQNEMICQNFSIFGNAGDFFNGDILWNEGDSRDISDYKLFSEELKINAEYPRQVIAGKYQLCISAENKGKYYGALLYKLNNSSYGIGTWVYLDVASESSLREISEVTGSVIGNNNSMRLIFLLTSVFIFLLLLLLLIKLKNKI